MSFFALLPLRFWLYLGLVSALTLGAWRLHHVIYQQGYERAKVECVAAANKAEKLAQAQHDKQAAQAAAAVADYEKQASITENKLKASRHDLFVSTQNLAGCRLDVRSISLLNDAGDYNAAKP